MERFCAGDQAAFGELFKRLGPLVQRFLWPMVRDRALAEDLTQTAFMSVIRSKDRYEQGAPVAPWVLTVAANAARDTLRRRGREQAVTPATEERTVDPEAADPGLRKVIEGALAELPAAQREAVILHRLQGLSFEEIAAVLGTTSGAARIRAHRGYERLRELLHHLESS
jgi:RNA polymerase sigma-70 factor (ECF subfamily)